MTTMDSQKIKKAPYKTERSDRLSWIEIKIKNPWFFIIIWALGISTFLFSFFVFMHFHSLRDISPEGKTDYPILIAAVLTLIIAAFTLLVSWYIKDEAEGIGDKIITSTVIHRHLDRMLHEYSLILLKSYEKSRAEKEPHAYFKIDFPLKSSEWFVIKYKKELDANFFSNLMPGISGGDFSNIFGFNDMLKKLHDNIASEQALEIFRDNIENIFRARNLYFKKVDYIINLCKMPSFDPEHVCNYQYEIIANYDKILYKEYPDDYEDRGASYINKDTQEDYPANSFDEVEIFADRVNNWDKLQKKLESDIDEMEKRQKTDLSTNENSLAKIPETAEEICNFGDRLKEARKYYKNKSEEIINNIKNTAVERALFDQILNDYNSYINLIDKYLKISSEISGHLNEIRILSKDTFESGAAIHRIMTALGWHLSLSIRHQKIEEEVEKLYVLN